MRSVKFGIVGGMGPEADELFQRHIRIASGAGSDREHLSVTVVKNPDIPDRSAHLLEGGPDPVPEILYAIRDLEAANVQFAVMPCNTAHCFYKRLQQQSSLYLLDMAESAMREAASLFPGRRAGLLATTGTVESGIYSAHAANHGADIIVPDATIQRDYVQKAIYGEGGGIKSGRYAENAPLLSAAVDALREKGASVIMLGCTELPLLRSALQAAAPDMLFFDPAESAARRVIRIYKQAEELTAQLSRSLRSALSEHVPQPSLLREDGEIARFVALKALKAAAGGAECLHRAA